ncbi:MAG: response regulator [Myxococcota bacterium]
MTERVLVVDDERSVCEMLRTLVAARGFSVETAYDGETAVERFAQGGIDAVFCDVVLPGQSGLETLEKMHEIDPDVPVVLMTAYADKSKLTRAVRLDAFDFLEKPFDLVAVEVSLRRALAQRALLAGRRKSSEMGARVDELLRRLNATHDSAQLFRTFQHLARETLAVDGVVLYARVGTHLELRSGRAVSTLEATEWPLSIVQCVESGEITALEDSEALELMVSSPVGLFLPIRMELQVWGVVLFLRQGMTFDDIDMRHLRMVVDHLASSIAVRERSEELERALRALEETQGRLLRTEKLASVTKLVAGMAHEIKNPLTSMQFAIANAEHEIDSLPQDRAAGVRRFIDLLGSDVKRLRDRVDRFMELARPDAAARAAVEVEEVIAAVVESLKPRASAGGIDLVFSAESIPPFELDPVGLENAVTNLVVNAIEADVEASQQVTRIDVGLRLDDVWAVVWVEDNGPGLSLDARERMFDIFFTTKARGAGLGLSQVHVFMETHGGDVRWHSSASGTRFELWLPRSVSHRRTSE